MIRPVLLLFSLLLILDSFGQDQKFVRLLGNDFEPIQARKSIPYMEPDPSYKTIPSTTILHDTSGLVYLNEYLLFRNYIPAQKAGASYLKTTFVSNAEYQEFQNWVRDSNAREKIYQGIPSDEEALKYLETDVKEIRKRTGSELSPYRNERAYPFNWKTQFNYTDPELMPLLADMYLPKPERFYGKREFDKRKFTYFYLVPLKESDSPLRLYTVLIDHPAFWANQSVSCNDEFAVLGQGYDCLLPASPVIGLTGMQAHAFCRWKEVQLQQQLDQQHIPYRVRVTLPMIHELTEMPSGLTVPERNYTTQWKIRVQDYRAFVEAVRDSVLIEALYAELSISSPGEAAKLLRSQTSYFDEYHLVCKEFDPKDTAMNRDYFSLKQDKNLVKKYSGLLKAIESRVKERLDWYVYFRMDIAEKAIVGTPEVREVRAGEGYQSEPKRLEILEINDLTGEPVGMDMELEWSNQLGNGAGVRDHENYSRFILRDSIRTTPSIPIETQKPEDVMKGITYAQALAYYHWKYPVWKAKTSDNWQYYIYPDETQFGKIQQGEQLIIPEHRLSYPSPVFRYVVTFIPFNQ